MGHCFGTGWWVVRNCYTKKKKERKKEKLLYNPEKMKICMIDKIACGKCYGLNCVHPKFMC